MTDPSASAGSARSRRKLTANVWRAEIRESFLMAMSAVAAHKLRSALTLLGVLVGVFSIIVVMTAIRVFQSNVESELSQLGTDTFTIQKWPEFPVDGPEWERISRRKSITYQIGRALQREATLPLSVGQQIWFWRAEAFSRTDKSNPSTSLFGVTPEAFSALNWVVGEGRAIIPSDIDSGRYVCVLGQSLSRKLFPRSSAVGQKVKFDGIGYSVIGVLESKGGSFGGDQDNYLAIPITTGLGKYGGKWRSVSILVQARNQAVMEDTLEQARGIMRKIRKVPPGEPDDFEIASNDSLVGQFRSFTGALRIGAALISSIALLAAGIGIMNIMLVSVTERTREIGIRRAIGAKKRNIMSQFIMEAIVLCQIGGIMGVILGIAGGNIAAFVMKVPAVIPMDWVAFGLLICTAVGVIFGTYPAYKAANLDPIESLRYE